MAIIASPPRIPSLTSFLTDVVGVYDSGFVQLFPSARPIRAFVKEESKLMIQPLETGAEIISHRIIIPTEIEMPVILQVNDFFNTYQVVKQLWNSGDLLKVQTKTDVYSNQILYSVSHDENTEMQNTVTMFLKFREAQFAPVPQYAVTPKNPSYGDSTPRGEQQGIPLTEEQIRSSFSADIYDAARSFLGQ